MHEAPAGSGTCTEYRCSDDGAALVFDGNTPYVVCSKHFAVVEAGLYITLRIAGYFVGYAAHVIKTTPLKRTEGAKRVQRRTGGFAVAAAPAPAALAPRFAQP